MRRHSVNAVLLAGTAMIATATLCTGQETSHWNPWERVQQDVKFSFQALLYMDENGIMRDSLFNPGNRLANIPLGGSAMELRPNLQWKEGKFNVIAKPRLTELSSFDTGIPGTDSNAGHFYMQEWAARTSIVPKTMLSFGREVLLWGPSMSISPSNPFFTVNGRANPIKEIGGRDFFRAVLSPNTKYSISYLLNTGAGRDTTSFGPFRRIQAIKLDYTPKNLNASVILSRKMGSDPVLGGFVQATVSNSLLVYAESSVQRGSSALYPLNLPSAAPWQMAAIKIDSSHIYSTTVVGTAYTLTNGPTLTFEYIDNRNGYTSLEARQYYQLAAQNSQLFNAGGAQAGTSAQTLGEALFPGLLTLRQNYVFAQFLRTNVRSRADFMIRYTLGLDDQSGTLAGYATFNCTDRIQLFAVGMVTHGGLRTEAGQILRHQTSAGARFFIR